MASKLAFSFLHYFWLNVQAKFELRNYLVASYYFYNMGKIWRFTEFIWSLWFLFHTGPSSDSLPLLPRVPCKFKLNLQAEALQKNYTAAAQVHKTHIQWTKRENRVVCTHSRSVLDKENCSTLRNFTLHVEEAKICRHLKIREGGELVTDHV